MFVTDVDGTLVGHRVGFEQYQVFRRYMGILREKYGARWVICTGRSLRSFRRVFRPMMMLGIMPDYVISRHAYIYERKSPGWVPHGVWNLRVRWLQWRHEWKVRRTIPRMRRQMLRKNPFARVVLESRGRITFQFEDEGATQFGLEIIRLAAQSSRYLQVFQYPCEVDVRAIPFTKGLAISELAKRVGVTPERILVVGDGHNDISMMQPEVARWTSCPVNAAPEVLEAVHEAGGHIASSHSLLGVLETLKAYEEGALNSRLPPSYAAVNDRAGGSGVKPAGSGKGRFGIRGFLTLLLVVLVVVLVLAKFNLLPFAHGLVMAYERMIDSIVRLLR